jgi:hypothetical protein
VEQVTERKEYQGFYKDNEGEAHVVDMQSVTYAPEVDTQQFLTQAAPTIIRPSRAKPRQRTDLLLADIGDLQFGYRRHLDGTLEPLHDERAVDVSLQVIKDQQPNVIILGGDELDMPELSKYPHDSRHFVDTFQTSIDGLHKLLAQLRADNPNARIINLPSNHTERLSKFMIKNAMPLFGIRRANRPEDFAAMSYPNLLRLEELDIEYQGGYPAHIQPINDRLVTIHGDRSNARGSTASMYLNYFERSVMFHHTHRQESLTRTTQMGRYITAFSFGALTSNGGAVPSHGSAVDERDRVVPVSMNWQNGMGFVEYREGDYPFQQHPILIDPKDNYEIKFDGKVYTPNGETSHA